MEISKILIESLKIFLPSALVFFATIWQTKISTYKKIAIEKKHIIYPTLYSYIIHSLDLLKDLREIPTDLDYMISKIENCGKKSVIQKLNRLQGANTLNAKEREKEIFHLCYICTYELDNMKATQLCNYYVENKLYFKKDIKKNMDALIKLLNNFYWEFNEDSKTYEKPNRIDYDQEKDAKSKVYKLKDAIEKAMRDELKII